jgi:hypothetical protein
VIEATQIGGRRSDRLMAGKLSPGNFGLLQQYLPQPDSPARVADEMRPPDEAAPECAMSVFGMLSVASGTAGDNTNSGARQ